MSSLILPYALWPDAAALTAHPFIFPNDALPHLRQWLQASQAVRLVRRGSADVPSLSMPHEMAQADANGWPAIDGLLPWAAQAACDAGLAQSGEGSAWGFVSLCHWQVSHGLATLTDPSDLALDDASDAALFDAMRGFFAEDGLVLHRWRPGIWLVRSDALAHLPTASLDRVIGEDVDGWLVGGDAPDATARVWRRLQNEMQMLLYTHPLNAERRVPVNSFWLHGTGALPQRFASAALPDARLDAASALRDAFMARDLARWRKAWQALDAQADWSAFDRLVLCGAHSFQVYERRAGGASWWQALRARVAPTPWSAWLVEPDARATGRGDSGGDA